MSCELEPARWPNGPKICPVANLPAFPTEKDFRTEHERFSPGVHVLRVYLCEHCGHWHADTVGRGPGGESSGTGRFNKMMASKGPQWSWITLTPEDQETAIKVSAEIFRLCRERNQQHRYNADERYEHTEEDEPFNQGAEFAAARALGLPLTIRYKPDKRGDIAPGVQVRATPVSKNPHLIIHRELEDDGTSDDPRHQFFLVTGEFPSYTIRGWQTGAFAQSHPEFWGELQKGRPAFNVPENQLIGANKGPGPPQL